MGWRHYGKLLFFLYKYLYFLQEKYANLKYKEANIL